MKAKHIILPLALLALLFLSCGKQEGASGDESLAPHSIWTDSTPEAFWDKQQGDITINPYTL